LLRQLQLLLRQCQLQLLLHLLHQPLRQLPLLLQQHQLRLQATRSKRLTRNKKAGSAGFFIYININKLF
jgi:hypothetical protein